MNLRLKLFRVLRGLGFGAGSVYALRRMAVNALGRVITACRRMSGGGPTRVAWTRCPGLDLGRSVVETVDFDIPPFLEAEVIRERLDELQGREYTWEPVQGLVDFRVIGPAGYLVGPDGSLQFSYSAEIGPRPTRRAQFDHPAFLPGRGRRHGARRLAKAIHLAGSNSDVYYHWLFEILPKLGRFREAGVDCLGTPLLVGGRRMPFKIRTLELLGIREEDIHYMADGDVSCDSLIACPTVPRLYIFDYVIRFLRESLGFQASEGHDWGGGERVLVSRKGASMRRLMDPGVEDWFLEQGFKSVSLERLDVLEQIRLFQGAKYIAGVHGSGLSNLIFCHPTTRVMELFSGLYPNPLYSQLAVRLGLDYFPVVDRVAASGRADITADVALTRGEMVARFPTGWLG